MSTLPLHMDKEQLKISVPISLLMGMIIIPIAISAMVWVLNDHASMFCPVDNEEKKFRCLSLVENVILAAQCAYSLYIVGKGAFIVCRDKTDSFLLLWGIWFVGISIAIISVMSTTFIFGAGVG